jgi:hypothetical protein
MIALEDIRSTQSVTVYTATDFIVTEGVAENESMSFADDLVLDDIYHLAPKARQARLAITMGPAGYAVADDSAAGQTGNTLHLDCCITLMGTDSTTREALLIVEVENGAAVSVFLLPLGPLRPGTDYRLIGIDRSAAARRFADTPCVAFTRGTRVTLASGLQVPIEALKVGDQVLTRDGGPQPIRWTGLTTVQATGAAAPIVIDKGVLHNEADLILAPDHRIFVYQRAGRLVEDQAGVLVKVRHLVNGTSVRQTADRRLDYVQLMFDMHQIIYVEGIAAESLLIDPYSRARLQGQVRGVAAAPGQTYRKVLGDEVDEASLARPGFVDLLRQSLRAV